MNRNRKRFIFKYYDKGSKDHSNISKKVDEDLRTRELVQSIIKGDNIENENFAILKTRHSAVELVHGDEPAYWPIELSIVFFNLKEGKIKEFSVLINTPEIPPAYSLQVKETIDATGLPYPGTIDGEEKGVHGYFPLNENYYAIVSIIFNLIQKHLVMIDDERFMLLALEDEIESTRGALKWLINNSDENEQEKKSDRQSFLNKCVFFPLQSFFVHLALRVKALNCEYKNPRFVGPKGFEKATDLFTTLTNFELEEYAEKCSCPYHYHLRNEVQVFRCCRFICLSQMLAIFKEFCSHLKIETQDGHDFNKFPNVNEKKI